MAEWKEQISEIGELTYGELRMKNCASAVLVLILFCISGISVPFNFAGIELTFNAKSLLIEPNLSYFNTL